MKRLQQIGCCMVVAVPTYHFLDKIGHAKSIPKWRCQMEMLHKKVKIGRTAINRWVHSIPHTHARQILPKSANQPYKRVASLSVFWSRRENRIGTEHGESQSDAHQSPRSRDIFLLTYPTQLPEIAVAAAANGERTEDNSQTSYRVVIVCAEEADRSGITCVRTITTTTTTRTISTKNKTFGKTRCISWFGFRNFIAKPLERENWK